MPPKLPDWALPVNERKKGQSSTSSSQKSSTGNTQKEHTQSNQQSPKETQSQKKPQDGFDRVGALNSIGDYLKNTGLMENQQWIIPLFEQINPEIKQRTIQEVGTHATEQELKQYISVLKPVNDLTVIAKHYQVQLEDVLKFVQILVPTVKIENLFSCFKNVTISHVKEVIEMVKGDLQNGVLIKIA